MLRVSVDIVPYGCEDRIRNLYTIEIINIGGEGVTVGEDGEPRCSYKVRTVNEEGKKVDHGVLVRGFDRNQPAHILVGLVYRALMAKGAIE